MLPTEIENYQSPEEGTKPSDGATRSPNIELSTKEGEDPHAKLESMVKDLVTGEFQTWASWRIPFEYVWDQIYRLYFSSPEQAKLPTRAKIFIPVVFQIIEAAVPKVINTLFNGEEFFDVVPVNAADQPVADSIKLLLNYQLSQSDLFLKFIDFTKQLFLYGTSYFHVYWKVRRQWVWTKVPVKQDVSFWGFKLGQRIVDWEEKKEFKVVEKRPELDVIDILDVYPDPDAHSDRRGEDGKAVWIRSFMDIDALKELGMGPYPVYDNTNDPQIQGGGSLEYTNSRKNRFAVRNTTGTPSTRQVELLTRWGLYDLDGDGIREESVIVIANRKVVLKAISNPNFHQRRPIIRCNLFPVPGEWYGVGLVEPIIPLQHEINTLRRQRLDNLNIIINRMWKVSDTADIDLDTLISSPNGIILTNDMKGIEAIETADVTSGAMLESQQAMQDIENTTITKAAQGTPESGRLGRTASGAKMIIGAALEKFGVVVRLIEETGLKRVLRMYHQLNIQMLDEDEVLRDPGLYGNIFDEKITADMLKAEVKFKMMGMAEMINKEGKINQIVSFFGTFANFFDGQTIATLAKMVWKLMGFNPDDVNIQGMANPQGIPGQPSLPQQTTESMAAQAAQNGTERPPAVPGTQLPGGVQ